MRDAYMDSRELLKAKREYLIGILTDVIDDYELWKAERKLQTTEYDFNRGMVVHMEYIDKIYTKLLKDGSLAMKELWFYLYPLYRISTLRVYEKMGRINRFLNSGKKRRRKPKGFVYGKG
jgi:hypothetical protein